MRDIFYFLDNIFLYNYLEIYIFPYNNLNLTKRNNFANIVYNRNISINISITNTIINNTENNYSRDLVNSTNNNTDNTNNITLDTTIPMREERSIFMMFAWRGIQKDCEISNFYFDNITKILEVFEDEDYILITMEYINGGNLFSFVKKRRKLSEKTAKFLFKQIILGIQHIHSHKIVHRDIKLENILIDLNNNIKICDFGIGKILTYNKQLLYDKCGTPMYMAPEILLSSKNHGYEGYPVDIWSAGISLYIMLSGTLPFNLKNNESSSIEESSENNIELQYSIINNEPKYIEKISDEARDLLKGLLNKNPNKRLTIEQILNHPWLQMDNKGKNKKYHLFAKAEIIMLSKTYIDYRNGNIDDLKENFTLSNLKKDKETKKDKNKIKNISTKSSLLAPYNTLIQEDDSEMDNDFRDCLEDINNPNIVLENDIILIKNKVKEFNLNYELNNNGECDNGMLINTKTGTISSSLNNSSKIEGRLTNRRNEDENLLDELNDENDEQGEEHENKINKILDEIEKLGYDKKYVLNCVNKNILCYASSVFYLMLNYKNI